MRRSSIRPAGRVPLAWLCGVILAIGLTAAPASAAPLLQDQRPVIAQPEENAVVRGVVQVVGTATHPDFQRYELYYAPWPVASDNAWIFIGPDAHFQQQPLGLLGTWDSRAVPDGAYALRVRVVKKDGNYYDSDPRRVTVANVKPPDTPTPTITPTATGEPTEAPTLEPTATIVVEMPSDNKTPTVMPTATSLAAGVPAGAGTPEPSPTPLLSSGDTGSAVDLTPLINTDRLGAVARQSAIYTLGVFALLAIFFGFKALLVWLWNKTRP